MMGLVLLIGFLPMVCRTGEQMREGSYSVGDSERIYGKIKMIWYEPVFGGTYITIDDGFTFRVRGDITDDYREGDSIFAKVTYTGGLAKWWEADRIFPLLYIQAVFYILILVGLTVIVMGAREV